MHFPAILPVLHPNARLLSELDFFFVARRFYLPSFAWFLVFSFFHSLGAHDFFKDILASRISKSFVENYWRLIYCILSVALLGMSKAYLATGPVVLQLPFLIYPPLTWCLTMLVSVSSAVLVGITLVQLHLFSFLGIRQMAGGVLSIFVKSPRLPVVDEWMPLKRNGLYSIVRHPMMVFSLLVLVSFPPAMNQIFYSLEFATYMIIGGYFEERKLLRHYGGEYQDYQESVGQFFPKPRQFKAWATDFFQWALSWTK